MSSYLLSVLRTAAQVIVGYLVTWLATHGINVAVDSQNWLIQVVLVGGGVALYTAAVRWLEMRKGSSMFDRLARAVAKVLMLGLTARQPVYPPARTGTS